MLTSRQQMNSGLACLVALLAILLRPSATSAQTPAFIPGDAFFVFLLSEKLLDAMPAEGGDLSIPYHVAAPAFGRMYTGFPKLLIKDVKPVFVQGVRWAYFEHRRSFPKITRADGLELNPPVAFIYNHDVDWKATRIGLKYNEDWPEPPPSGFEGPSRNANTTNPKVWPSRYVPLVRDYDAVVNDWQNAREVARLRVEVPKNVAWAVGGDPIATPVSIPFDKCQCIITTQEDLEVYFRQLPLPDGPVFFRISGPEVSECYWEQNDDGEPTLRCDKRDINAPLSQTLRRATSPSLYYGMVREGRRNGDITIPMWPDCRIPLGMPASLYSVE